MPSYGPQTPAHEWELGTDGHAAARQLAAALPTLRDPRLNEVARIEPWEGEYLHLRREYVSGIDHVDWEPRAAVAARFEAGLREHLDSAQEKPLIVATHGMAMTIWLTSRRLLGDPAEFWTQLLFPDAHIVDPNDQPGTVIRHPASTQKTTS